MNDLILTPPKVTYREVKTLSDLVRALGYDTSDVRGLVEAWNLMALGKEVENQN